MINHPKLLLCAASLFVCVLSVSAYAKEPDPAEVAYKDLFGKDERAVRHTREMDDDIAFAKRLYKEAGSGQHDAGLTTLLYEKAYETGLRDAKGYQTSDNALDKLLEDDETKKFAVADMRLVLMEKWHESEPDGRGPDLEAFIDLSLQLSQEAVEAGEMDWALKFLNRVNRLASRSKSLRMHDVRDTITELVRTRKTLDEIADLKESIGTDPAAADKLAMVYLAQLDDPESAALYADQFNDLALTAKVLLAATAFELATPEGANEAGVFYLGLVKEGKTREPVAMLIRARVWLTEYLSREPDDTEAVQAANQSLGEIDQDLLKRGIGKKLRRKMSAALRGEGQFGRPANIQAAIDKGVEWLYSQHKDKTHWEQDSESHRNWGGYTALVTYALLMADEEPQVNGDLSRAVHFMMNAEMKGTYPICFRIHAWEVLPRRERYRQTLMRDISRLRSGGTKHGYWGYTMTGKDVVPGSRLDTSTTLAGGLGLWIGEEVGGVTPKNIYWERTARALIKYQNEDNGWSYNPAVDQTSQGAMTAGGLALLHASYPHLSDATKPKVDEAITRGLQWMDENFSPTTNVNRGNRFNAYYFAAVQHAGLFSGKRDFGGMDWYESIAEHLVKTQSNNGAWGDVSETAFAVAFLCRGGIVYEQSETEFEPEDTVDTPDDSPAEQPVE